MPIGAVPESEILAFRNWVEYTIFCARKDEKIGKWMHAKLRSTREREREIH